MSLECGCGDDAEYFIEVPDTLSTSEGTLICNECKQLIPAGTPHYRVWTWNFNEFGDETIRHLYETCEVCGDLAITLLERGFCWYFGELRYDIQTLHEMETKKCSSR